MAPGDVPQNPDKFLFDPIQGKCTVRGVKELPDLIFEQHADDIEILDASHCQMDSLPDYFGDLKKLRVAFFSYGLFEDIPEVLANCPNLEMIGFKSCHLKRLNIAALPQTIRDLIVTDNEIPEIPENIDRLERLRKLTVTGNLIKSFPRTMLNCKDLEKLRAALNLLEESPDWLFEHPSLAWYGDAGNPFREHERSQMPDVPDYRWSELAEKEEIGRSAMNVVYRAQLEGQPVAVKLFGAGITSDGNPIDDMNASLQAGEHHNIIGGLGKVHDGPDGRQGFIMPLVPPEYQKLGLPPSFSTFTRDVYPEGTIFTDPYTRSVLRSIAAAMHHLASRGIMNGDIYAHNILSRVNGESIMGDFGAATLYQPGSEAGALRERIEVRAFGYLMDDMLTHSASKPAEDLVALRDACLASDPTSRPKIEDIHSSFVS